MDNDRTSLQKKDLAFLISGLTDCLLGGGFLLVWLRVVPLDLEPWGIPLWVVGLTGALLALFGVGVLAWVLARERPPD